MSDKTFISIPAFKMQYVAAPKGDKDGPLAVKAITLEELTNVNGWRVPREEFERVASQYKDGRQLRLNHSKDVQEIIGKSFDSKVIDGKDITAYMGQAIPGIITENKYVVTEFEADPKDAQVRANILRGYVDTGSIGLDAKASCDECGEPLAPVGDDMVKTCRHLEAGVRLTEVEVKEYSYVSEPAYPHSKILPTFAAAVSRLPKPKVPEESSLSIKPTPEVSAMSVVQPTVSVEAKKAAQEADGEGDGEDAVPQKYHDAIMAAYKKGMEDERKYRAKDKKDEEDSESEASAKKASVDAESKITKTDQIGRVAVEAPVKTNDLMDRILRPTSAGMDPALKELFRAAAESPDAPPEIRSKFKGRFE